MSIESPIADQSVTVKITRTVLVGREAEFEALLRAFIPKALTFPGHLGVHVLKPATGLSREYHVVLKFASREQLGRFRQSPEYQDFSAVIEQLLERQPCVEELTGLESWFTLPAHGLQPLPRWKMALVTLLGVYPTSTLIVASLGSWLEAGPFWLQSFIVAVLMVALLTWVVMPVLTRVFRPWLYPSDSSMTSPTLERMSP